MDRNVIGVFFSARWTEYGLSTPPEEDQDSDDGRGSGAQDEDRVLHSGRQARSAAPAPVQSTSRHAHLPTARNPLSRAVKRRIASGIDAGGRETSRGTGKAPRHSSLSIGRRGGVTAAAQALAFGVLLVEGRRMAWRLLAPSTSCRVSTARARGRSPELGLPGPCSALSRCRRTGQHSAHALPLRAFPTLRSPTPGGRTRRWSAQPRAACRGAVH